MRSALWLMVGLMAGAAAGWRAKTVSSVTLSEDARQAIAEAMANPGKKIPFRSGEIMVGSITEHNKGGDNNGG